MKDKSLPPPHETFSNVPDYYLGCLLYYDTDGEDSCKYVVYDGTSRVRCPTRSSAMDYIRDRHERLSGQDLSARIIDARISLNRAIQQLDQAANETEGLEQLIFRRLAVRLKPVLVDIDNITIHGR